MRRARSMKDCLDEMAKGIAMYVVLGYLEQMLKRKSVDIVIEPKEGA